MRRSRKKVKEQKRFSKTKLHFIIYVIELVLLFFILSILVTDMYGEGSEGKVTESSESEIKELPEDVKVNLESVASGQEIRVPVLMYHYIEYVDDLKDTFRQSLNIEPHIFEAQIKTLKDGGYTFMTAEELGYILDGRMNLPEKSIVITLDDGHWDIHTDVLPLLRKYNVKVTAYVIPGLLGGSDFLSKNQLKEVINSGLVDIGAHTVHHMSLPDLNHQEMEFEVKESKRILEEEFDISVESFAYPNGAFDSEVMEVVKRNNYTLAVSTIPGISQSLGNRYFIYRLRPGRRVGDELLKWLSQESFQAF